ncbi:PKD domain-containing protein [Halorientalis pallida]|uniref:PKD domain-containing protein n=1 Tax=Halorientalis pallida TaxID=2479928 RepID=A0A498L195_9EURY|nr:PKD domain-containing protein [Halorientalis pallida]RXK51847.1 PKD domain-containing protein [Halorientalis pallida]
MRAESVSVGRRPLLLLIVLAICVAAVPPGIAAGATDTDRPASVTADGVATVNAPSPDDVTITVEQGEECYDVEPLGNGTRTVEAFYDYDVSTNYSSNGTTELQENQVSNLLIYHGSEGYSLVLVHDKYEDGAYGGVTSMTFTGLPTDGEWAVEDDGYDGRDDDFEHQGTRSEIDWMWYEDRTDGAAFRGLTASETVSITIEPAFNEDAAAWGEWNASDNPDDRIEEWRLFTGPEEQATLDRDANVTVNRGGCDQPPSAALAADPATAAVDESVTLNATDATDDEGIRRYGWDFDGDGTVDLNTTAPTAAYTYESTGDYEAAVTVWDYANNTATASTTVTVTENSSDGDSGDEDSGNDGDESEDGSETDGPDDVPVPALTGPATAAVGETVTLDANASTDGDGIQSYGWNFDGDTTVDRTTTAPTTETSFDAAGTYTVVVTVSDENGNEATAEHVIEVDTAGDDPPTGEIDAPDEATVGDPITVEAVNLSDGLTHVCWFFDGESGPEEPTAQHTFDEPGTHEIVLQLKDERGQETEITTEISVAEDGDSEGGANDGDSGGDGSDGGADDGDGSDGDAGDSDEDTDDGDSEDDGSDGETGDSDEDTDDGDSEDDGSDGETGDSDEDTDDGDSEDDGSDGDSDEGSEDGANDGAEDDGTSGVVGVADDINPQGPGIGPIDLSEPESDDSADTSNGTENDSSVSVAAVRTGRTTVDAGSSVEITVSFDETSDGTDQVPLTLRRQRENGTDTVVDELAVAVPENETETVSVATTVERPGEYRAGVGNRTAAFSVLAPMPDGNDDGSATDQSTASRFGASAPADDPAESTDATTDDTTTGANGPGFGLLAAALGLVLAGLLAARRRFD